MIIEKGLCCLTRKGDNILEADQEEGYLEADPEEGYLLSSEVEGDTEDELKHAEGPPRGRLSVD